MSSGPESVPVNSGSAHPGHGPQTYAHAIHEPPSEARVDNSYLNCLSIDDVNYTLSYILV